MRGPHHGVQGESLEELHAQEHEVPHKVPGRRRRARRSEAECTVHLGPAPVRVLMYMSVSDRLNEGKLRKDSQPWERKDAVTTDVQGETGSADLFEFLRFRRESYVPKEE